jgi:photosystem II stability/assembly factor-like uncharacterized protein
MDIIKFLTLAIFTLLFSLTSSAQRKYKEMMGNPSVNFYDVCREADAFFKNNSKGKGSGYKGYQRWKNENESKYAPSGDRSNVDPRFVEKAYRKFLASLDSNESSRSFYPSGWKDLGPYTIDSITGHYSAGLGRIETFYVHPTNTQIMYVGSRSGGFWKSNNGGVNWTGGYTDTLPASGVESIAVFPTNSDSILIAVQNGGNSYSHGIYRSIDGGNTWTLSNFNPTNLGKGGLGDDFKINTIAYHPRISNLIFIAASDGLYRSSNNLATWSKVTAGSISEIEFHPVDNNVIYIYDYYYWGANKNKILYSLNQGLTFSGSNTIVGNSNSSGKISISKDCNDCVFFASSNGIWTSTNKGVDFTFMSNPPETCDGFAVNDLDTSKMIYGYLDILNSIDGGRTSNQITWWSLGSFAHAQGNYKDNLKNGGKYIHADLRVAQCINGVFYVGTDGLFAKSIDDGNTWIILSDGLGIRENYSLGVSQSNHYRTMSGSQDNGTSIKHKDAWVEFYGADGMEAIIHPLNDDYMMGSVQYGSRRKTTDGGLTQSGANASGQSGSGNGAWEAPLAYDPNDQMRIYNFAKDLYVSDQFGGNWSYLSQPFNGTTISEAAIAENNSAIILVSRGAAILKSTDGGITFTNIKRNLPNYTITDIAFNPRNDDNFFVTYNRYQNDGQKIFMTVDGGSTWSNITYNLGDMPLRNVVVDHTNESNIYLGAEIGVFTKALTDTVWKLHNQGLPNSTIKELEIVNGSNSLRAAIWGRGLWEYTLVGRENFPSILTTRINDMPTTQVPRESIDQHVTSVVSSSSPLSAVFLEWSTSTPTFGNRIGMVNTTDSTYVSSTPIPNFPMGTKVFFKVFAVNANNDTTETYKFQYTVRFNPRASLDIKEEDKINVTVFPNPTDGNVKLAFESSIQKGNITLFDELGRQILSQQINGLNSVELDVTQCASGLYFIVIQADNKRSIEKLIKK